MTKKNNNHFLLKNQIKFMNTNPIHENLSISKTFTKCGQFSTIFTHLKKTDASREKLNDLHMANSSTPLNRAFFIRNLRTSKENALSVLLSMVGRKGQPLAVGCLPYVAVSHPFTLYRQTVRSLAVDMKNLHMGLSQMLYKFILLGKNRLHLTILADSEQQARNRLTLTRAICYARINPNHNRTLGGAYV